MAEADLLIPLGTETFTAAITDDIVVSAAGSYDLGPGLHLVTLIGVFTAMDFGTPVGNASYGMNYSFDGVEWNDTWDWRNELVGNPGDIDLLDSDPHTLPETVHLAGTVARYVRVRMPIHSIGASFTVKSSLLVTGGTAL